MEAVFLGERSTRRHGSGLTGVFNADAADADADDIHDDGTPPDRRFRRGSSFSSVGAGSFSFGSLGASSYTTDASSLSPAAVAPPYAVPTAWLELWDFVGCGSFRGFLAEDPAAPGGPTSLFAFFDASVLSRDLKRALMALIELADSALGCAHLVVCVDRRGVDAQPAEAAELLKGLQWAGFSLTTLDAWTGGACVDVTSSQWIFMGMEL